MASAFAHALTGFTIGKLSSGKKMPVRFWLLALIVPIIPDIDSISRSLGISHDHLLSHRGVTHSVLFAFVLALLIVEIFFNRKNLKADMPISLWRLRITFFLIIVSHGLLDAMTNGGSGVGFWIPFTNERFFLPWRPIEVSPLSAVRFFTVRGWDIIQSELVWVGLPCMMALMLRKVRLLKR